MQLLLGNCDGFRNRKPIRWETSISVKLTHPKKLDFFKQELGKILEAFQLSKTKRNFHKSIGQIDGIKENTLKISKTLLILTYHFYYIKINRVMTN